MSHSANNFVQTTPVFALLLILRQTLKRLTAIVKRHPKMKTIHIIKLSIQAALLLASLILCAFRA